MHPSGQCLSCHCGHWPVLGWCEVPSVSTGNLLCCELWMGSPWSCNSKLEHLESTQDECLPRRMMDWIWTLWIHPGWGCERLLAISCCLYPGDRMIRPSLNSDHSGIGEADVFVMSVVDLSSICGQVDTNGDRCKSLRLSSKPRGDESDTSMQGLAVRAQGC